MSGRKPITHRLPGNSGMPAPARQRGAVLIFALIVLLVMTVLAVSGVGNSTLEQRMAGNYTQSVSSFQAAEQALRVAEEWMYTKLANDSDFRDLEATAWWFKDTSTTDGLYTTIDSHGDNAKVCAGDDNCEFNPRDEAQWCSDMSDPNCRLPKGYIELSDSVGSETTLHSVSLSSIGQDTDGDGTIDTVAHEPRFIIEYVGPAGLRARNITLGTTSISAPIHAFRITVLAWGRDESVRTVLQSHVILPL